MLTFSACWSAFNIGEQQGFCDEMGCDYSDAGVCRDPFYVLTHKDKVSKEAYDGIDCYSRVQYENEIHDSNK